MSDKNLTELEWKRFAKGRSLKDSALIKALAELEKAKAPDAQLTALTEIEKQSDLLLKANKGDKELAEYLGDAGKAIDKQRKLSEFEAKKSSKSGGDEDDDGPAALGARMLPLLRQIAKGEDGAALPVMVAVAGKEVAVLVARRAIGPSQKKLLTEALGTTAGVKFMSGECLWEGNAHTFVLEAKVAKLAQGIKAALQKQTDTRFKVRVRGTDPNDVDDDGEESVNSLEDVEGGGSVPTVPPAPPLLPKQTSTPELKSGEPNIASKQFNERVSGLLPRIKDGIAASQAGAGGAKVKLSEAAVFARKLDWPAANALLDEIEEDLALDRSFVPPPLTEGVIKAKELKAKEAVELALRKVMPSQQDMHGRLERLISAGDKQAAELAGKLYKEMQLQARGGNPKAALALANRIDALTGSAEARRAELKHVALLAQDSYKQSVDEQIADLTPDRLDQLRREAASDGYGVTSDGMVRFALAISAAEWQNGAAAPVLTMARLLEQAASASAPGGEGGPLAALPFVEQIMSEQWPVMKLAERARQLAMDGGFDENPRAKNAAWDLPLLFSNFSLAVEPFLLMLADAKNTGEVQRSMEDLLPTLKDYPAPQGGSEPLAQLQQAIQACEAGEFTAAGALLLAIRDGLQATRSTDQAGDGFNEQIASEADNVQRGKVQSLLMEITNELKVLAAKKGLPFDTARSTLQTLDQAVQAFGALL